MIDILEETKRIQNLLEEQVWYKKLIMEIPKDSEKINLKKTLINRAVGIHINIENDEEKKLFEELLTEIDILTLSDYQHLVNKCYVSLRKKYPSIKQFYIIPLLTTVDSENIKVKSGLFVSYLFNTYQFSLINETEQLNDVKINIRRYLSNTEIEKIQKDEKSLIVFVDDFIGTGRSVKKVYKSYEENSELIQLDWKRKTCVLSLAILDTGFEMLDNDGLEVIYGLKHSNIPTKYNNNQAVLADIKKMIGEISRKSKIKNQYIYGYGECLSTIITIRTPNNNIPFLWSHKLKNSKALFVRNE